MAQINWNKTYTSISPKLLGICRRYIKDIATAEDIVQESFIVAIQKENTLKEINAVNGWLSKIVVNMALHHLRNVKKIKYSQSENYEFIDETQLMNTLEFDKKAILLASDLDKDDILEAIDQLPEHHKAVFNMYVIDQFSHKQISEMLAISVGTSKSHLSRARKNMQDYLIKKINLNMVDEKKKRRLALLLFLGFGDKLFANFYKNSFSDFSIQPSNPFSNRLKINPANVPANFVGLSKNVVSSKIIFGFVLFTFFISSILFFNYSKKATLNFNREKANSTKIITLDSINSTENKADLNKKDTLSKIKTFAIKQEKLKQIDMSYAKDYETQIATKTVSDSIKKDEIPKVIVIKKQIIKRDTVYVDK